MRTARPQIFNLRKLGVHSTMALLNILLVVLDHLYETSLSQIPHDHWRELTKIDPPNY